MTFSWSLNLAFWTCLNQFEPFWTTCRTILNHFEPIWTSLNHFEPCWTILNPFEPIETLLNYLEHLWTILIPVWTLLNLAEPFWTLFLGTNIQNIMEQIHIIHIISCWMNLFEHFWPLILNMSEPLWTLRHNQGTLRASRGIFLSSTHQAIRRARAATSSIGVPGISCRSFTHNSVVLKILYIWKRNSCWS